MVAASDTDFMKHRLTTESERTIWTIEFYKLGIKNNTHVFRTQWILQCWPSENSVRQWIWKHRVFRTGAYTLLTMQTPGGVEKTKTNPSNFQCIWTNISKWHKIYTLGKRLLIQCKNISQDLHVQFIYCIYLKKIPN